mmetsp:Transcript_63322/g.182160  ORF Transcript_63322/g.182160 Transcript_63322/m.182160 type:complete len:219 (-) Transcript_63322:1570-2226(-)
MRISGLPSSAHCSLKSVKAFVIRKAALIARTAWSGTELGAFHMARIASPMNSSIVPCSSTIIVTICSKYSANKANTSTGDVDSQMFAKPTMSEKNIVTFRWLTPRFASSPRLRKWRTTSKGMNRANEPTAPFRLTNAACNLRTSYTRDSNKSSSLCTLSNCSFDVRVISSINWLMGATSSFANDSASCEKISENPSKVTMTTAVKPIAYFADSTSSAR